MLIKKQWRVKLFVLAALALSALACGVGGEAAPTPTLYVAPTAQVGQLPPAPTTEGNPVEATAEAAIPSGNAEAAGGSDDVHPCTLFNQQAADTLFGSAAQPGIEGGEGYNDVYLGTCTYMSADNTQIVVLTISRSESFPPPNERFAMISGSVVEPVAGLGDAAVWDGDRSTLNVAKGPWTVALTATLTGGASAPLDKLTPIAQAVVAGLP